MSRTEQPPTRTIEAIWNVIGFVGWFLFGGFLFCLLDIKSVMVPHQQQEAALFKLVVLISGRDLGLWPASWASVILITWWVPLAMMIFERGVLWMLGSRWLEGLVFFVCLGRSSRFQVGFSRLNRFCRYTFPIGFWTVGLGRSNRFYISAFKPRYFHVVAVGFESVDKSVSGYAIHHTDRFESISGRF